MKRKKSPAKCPLKGCDMCIEAELLDQDIANTERSLAQLRQRRKDIKSLLNRRHDPFILRLPVELASRIFLYCHTFGPPNDSNPFNQQEGYDAYAPILLGSVCHDWRTIAYSTPALWTTITIRSALPTQPNIRSLVKEWCDRAASLPLDVTLSVDENLSPYYLIAGMIIDILCQYASQWRSITVKVPYTLLGRFQSKTTTPVDVISISTFVNRNYNPGFDTRHDSTNLNLGFVPKPSALKLTGAKISNVNIDWGNLTIFHTHDALHVTEFLHLLTIARRLQEVSIYKLQESDSDAHPTPLTHYHLHKLYLSWHPHQIWEYLTLPALTDLLCCALNDAYSSRFQPFLIRSECHLKELQLNNQRALDTIEVLSMLDELERLSFRIFDGIPLKFSQKMFDTAAHAQGQSEAFLPRLRSLQFYISGQEDEHFDWTSLSLLVSHHPTPTSRPIETIFIDCPWTETTSPEIGQDVLESILVARANGILVTIQNDDGDIFA